MSEYFFDNIDDGLGLTEDTTNNERGELPQPSRAPYSIRETSGLNPGAEEGRPSVRRDTNPIDQIVRETYSSLDRRSEEHGPSLGVLQREAPRGEAVSMGIGSERTRPQAAYDALGFDLQALSRLRGQPGPSLVKHIDKSRASLDPVDKDGQPKHICHECGKTFRRAHNLKIHGRLHNGDRPYKCPFSHCEKEFRWKSSIVSHLNWHRTKRGEVLPDQDGTASYDATSRTVATVSDAPVAVVEPTGSDVASGPSKLVAAAQFVGAQATVQKDAAAKAAAAILASTRRATLEAIEKHGAHLLPSEQLDVASMIEKALPSVTEASSSKLGINRQPVDNDEDVLTAVTRSPESNQNKGTSGLFDIESIESLMPLFPFPGISRENAAVSNLSPSKGDGRGTSFGNSPTQTSCSSLSSSRGHRLEAGAHGAPILLITEDDC